MDRFEVLRACARATFRAAFWCSPPRGEVKDRVAACSCADDYLPKHCMPELIARVRALGRRFAEEPPLNLRRWRSHFRLGES